MIIDFYNKNGGSGTVPIATRDTAGIVKVGAGLDIDSGGTLSVSGGTGGGLAVYDYDVISGDSTARTELINLVSGGTQTAVVVREGIMYYYRGYDEDKYIFVDYKNVMLPEQPQYSNRFYFRAIKVDANEASQDWYEQDIAFNIQQWMYTTNYYSKKSVSTNGFLYASDNTYDIIPGSTPKSGETYTNIYFTIPGMLWTSNGLTVTVNGDSHEISWWGGKSWNVDGEIYGEDHTTEAGMTVDFSHIDQNGYGYIGISAAAMTVTQVPENGEGGGTSVVPPVLANYNLQMYRSGEWHSICGVPNLIFSGASQGILASAVSTVKAGLYDGAYAGTDTFYILIGDLSQEAQSILYESVSGVSETVTLKAADYTAVIVKTISSGVYSLTITQNSSTGGAQTYNLSKMSQAELSALCADLITTYRDTNMSHSISSSYTASDYVFYYTITSNGGRFENWQVQMYLNDIDVDHVGFAGLFVGSWDLVVECSVILWSDGSLNNEHQVEVGAPVSDTFKVDSGGTLVEGNCYNIARGLIEFIEYTGAFNIKELQVVSGDTLLCLAKILWNKPISGNDDWGAEFCYRANISGVTYEYVIDCWGGSDTWTVVSMTPVLKNWVGTQVQYNALAPNYDNNTLYVIL